MPSKTGLMLQVATAGAEGYAMHKALTSPKTSVNTVGRNKFTQYGYK